MALTEELQSLAEGLDAVAVLSTFRTVVKASENSAYRHFLIRLDAKAGEVEIIARPTFSAQSEQYMDANNEPENAPAVLVSADSIEVLRRAYPNYFLDVGEFVARLREALGKGPYIDRVNTDFLRRWKNR